MTGAPTKGGEAIESSRMSYRDLSNLLLRIAGVAMIAFALTALGGYLSFYLTAPERSPSAFSGLVVIPIVIPLALGLALLFFPRSVTNRLVEEGGIEGAPAFDADTLQRVAFSVLALYLLFQVLSDLVYHGTAIYIAGLEGGRLDPEIWPTLIATLAELVFALFLLLGSGRLVRALRSVRT